MSEIDLPAKIQNLEQNLKELRDLIAALGTKIEGAEKNIQTLAIVKTRVERLKKIKQAKTQTELRILSANVETIRQELATQKGRARRILSATFKALLTYWALIAFVVTALFTWYIYHTYGVGYFEPYQNIQNTKLSAKYYVSSGDHLLARAEFTAAEEAFKTAVEINPYDITARRGLMLSQVLTSGEGPLQHSEITDAKLKYLENEQAFKDNPLLSYFHGRLAAAEGDRQKAMEYFQASSAQLKSFNQEHPDQRNEFIGNDIEIGILDMWAGKIDDAIHFFETPLVGDQKTALNHLSECYLVTGRFDQAWNALSKLYKRSPRVETYLILGDFFRYQYATDPPKYIRNLEAAKTMDILASKALTSTNPTSAELGTEPKLAYGKDYGRMHFLPIPLEDVPSFGQSVADADKPEQYQALTSYSLSLDYALSGDFVNANNYYDRALATDVFKEYPCQFVYKTRYYRSKMRSLSPTLRAFFNAKAETLVQGRCKAASSAAGVIHGISPSKK
jgi:tetratricopeptide (TPR) repeat protein